MTIERGDKLGPVSPADPEPAPKRSEDLDPLSLELPATPTTAEAHALGIAATMRRNL